MPSIEFDAHVGNLIWTLNILKQGRDAMRYGHAMSSEDAQVFNASREIVKHLLAKEFDNPDNSELITGFEQYIATYMETANANAQK